MSRNPDGPAHCAGPSAFKALSILPQLSGEPGVSSA